MSKHEWMQLLGDDEPDHVCTNCGLKRSATVEECRPLGEPLLSDLDTLEFNIRHRDWMYGDRPAIMGLLLQMLKELRGLREDLK